MLLKLEKIKKKYWNEALLPYFISLAAVSVAVFTFFAFADKALFIYDPYTIKTSDLTIKEIKKKAAGERVILKTVEMSWSDFENKYDSLLLSDSSDFIIISSHLYAMTHNDNKYSSYYKNKKISLFGPLFDYDTEDLNVSPEFRLSEYPWKGIDEVFFFIPAGIYEKYSRTEPESRIISALTESFLNYNPDGLINFRILLSDTSLPENSKVLSILCIRNPGIDEKNLIKRHKGKILFFDFINSKNLADPAFSAVSDRLIAFSYNYELTMKRLIAEIRAVNENTVKYSPVFTFMTPVQKK